MHLFYRVGSCPLSRDVVVCLSRTLEAVIASVLPSIYSALYRDTYATYMRTERNRDSNRSASNMYYGAWRAEVRNVHIDARGMICKDWFKHKDMFAFVSDTHLILL
jgi:hypothetical protein